MKIDGGETGETGESRESGMSGVSGKPGKSGMTGKPGISGLSGLSGISGQEGTDGLPAGLTKKTPGPQVIDLGARTLKRRRRPTLPHCIAVPSALAGLTSLFGMGRGGTPPQ